MATRRQPPPPEPTRRIHPTLETLDHLDVTWVLYRYAERLEARGHLVKASAEWALCGLDE
ncbi:hypothetical protein [Nocardia sp. NBC_01327]|uniref:hypothetical protein n=1 Tax=Nocardia sp. NBC_01327 TaxID=2903593 RepID=UPI002E155A0F|nr:hypothetical protein OG326_03245 [Nocardia sp. NBC_01327]